MDRRMFFAALGGLVATTSIAKAQGLLGGTADAAGNALGAGLAAPGQILGGTLGAGGDVLGGLGNGLGGGLGGDIGLGGGGFRLADLQGGQYSIETSHLALARSRSRGVREFAQLEINEQVSVAAALGASPGAVAPRPDQQALVDRLSQYRGAAFDHHYIADQIRGHEELLANNEQAIRSPADPAVRRVATVSVPTIQTHLAILHRLRAGVGAV